jgi:hypothetical protein
MGGAGIGTNKEEGEAHQDLCRVVVVFWVQERILIDVL